MLPGTVFGGVPLGLTTISTQTFTTSIQTSTTVPSTSTQAMLEVWAGGGGGLYTTNAIITTSAVGGGGGAYARNLISVTPSQTIYYKVGAGGAGSLKEAGSGGYSWVNISSNAAPVSISQGVLADFGSNLGVGGTTVNSIGQVKYGGGDSPAQSGAGTTAGGGGGAGSGGAGGNGADNIGGTGGSPDGGSGGTRDVAPVAPGGGGAGRYIPTNITYANGATGQVRITFYA